MATEERDALEAEAAQAAVVAHLDVGDTKYKQSMAEWFQDVHNLPSNKQPRRPQSRHPQQTCSLSTTSGLQRSAALVDCATPALGDIQ